MVIWLQKTACNQGRKTSIQHYYELFDEVLKYLILNI